MSLSVGGERQSRILQQRRELRAADRLDGAIHRLTTAGPGGCLVLQAAAIAVRTDLVGCHVDPAVQLMAPRSVPRSRSRYFTTIRSGGHIGGLGNARCRCQHRDGTR